MKTLEWMRFLESQYRQHGKSLFRVAELANVAGRDAHALNVELGRLVQKGVIVRYATGVYGLPDRATPEQLVTVLDDGAYITGAFALHRHNLVTQAPTEITCFTNRRHSQSRVRVTPFGRLVFIRVVPKIYCMPSKGALAPPEQAICDFVHLTLRQGLDPASIVTFREVARVAPRLLTIMSKRYSPMARRKVKDICALPSSPIRRAGCDSR